MHEVNHIQNLSHNSLCMSKPMPIKFMWTRFLQDQHFGCTLLWTIIYKNFLSQVCIFFKGKWEERELKGGNKRFLRLRTAKCHRLLKLEKRCPDLSSESWRKTWHLFCEFGTRGILIDVREPSSGCFRDSKLLKTVAFSWNELLRATSFTLAREVDMQLKTMVSTTPPVQAPYLLKCVPDRVTDDGGAMISEVILRMNTYRPQEGRWLTRTVLDHGGKECFVVRIR